MATAGWTPEIAAARTVLTDAGLLEEKKWGKPCFSRDGNNIAILQPMKSFLAMMFFKGALLDDPQGLLESQGPNSRSAKRLTFTSVEEVNAAAEAIRHFVRSAIAVEDAGVQLPPAPAPTLIDELRTRLEADPQLKAAFEGLTPGRQREYNLFFGSAKQSATRAARVEKAVPNIRAGRGLRDR